MTVVSESALVGILLGEDNNGLIYFMEVLEFKFYWAILDVAIVGEK